MKVVGGVRMRGRTSTGMKWGLVGGLLAGGALIPLIPVIRKRAMNVMTILKKDHRMVSGLLMTLEMTPRMNATIRKKLFEQIRTDLTVHAQAEEEVFYPVMRTLTFGMQGPKVDDAYREHQTMKELLNQMMNLDVMGDEFDNKLRDLKNTFQHHVAEEEGEMFEFVNRRMSKQQQEDLGQRLHNRKKDLKTRMAA